MGPWGLLADKLLEEEGGGDGSPFLGLVGRRREEGGRRRR